jgi:hypothetical protein
MYPHRIRLRGPWTCEPLYRLVATPDGRWQRSTENLPEPFRIKMPPGGTDIPVCPDFRGGVRLLRPFGYPGRIDEHERVWLTFAGLDGKALVILNEQTVGTIDGTAEFEITSLLRPRNTLKIEVESTKIMSGLVCDVALEVRASAFLRDVRFERQFDKLIARGVAIGKAPRLLELYLFAADRFLTYDRVQPTPTGQPFTLTGDLGGQELPEPLPVRVELIDAAVIWYIVEGAIGGRQSKAAADSS